MLMSKNVNNNVSKDSPIMTLSDLASLTLVINLPSISMFI